MPYKDPEKKRRAYNRAYQRKWRASNKDKIAKYNASPKSREARRNYMRGVRSTDEYRIARNLKNKLDKNLNMIRTQRARIAEALRRAGTVKTESTLKLLGCTASELKSHIEVQFAEGMSWDNRCDWHVDHIVPCAMFNLEDPIQQAYCFHYTNLQPMWADKNQSKGAKLESQLYKKKPEQKDGANTNDDVEQVHLSGLVPFKK